MQARFASTTAFSALFSTLSALQKSEAGPFARFIQGPMEGQESEWSFEGDWVTDVRAMGLKITTPRSGNSWIHF